jgi:ABC-type multidrug transport system permease subunit
VNARYQASAAAGIVIRDFLIFRSYPLRFLAQVLAIFFSVSLFYYVSRLVKVEQFGDSNGYFAFVVVGIATLEVLTATLSLTPLTVRGELVAGTFERLATTTAGPVASIAAMMVFPTLLALIGSAVTLVLAALVFGLSLNWPLVLLALPTAVLGAAAFLPFAMMLSALVLVVKQAGAGAAFIVSGLSIAGGAMFPVGLLPGWLEWISHVQPLSPALELLRWQVVGTPVDGSRLGALVQLVLFTAVLLPLGFAALAWAVRTCRRRGTLTEY